MNRDEIISNLEDIFLAKKIDWAVVESLIEALGENINDAIDDDVTILSELFWGIGSGKGDIVVKLTELFLKHGYDVSANDGLNGAACLYALC